MKKVVKNVRTSAIYKSFCERYPHVTITEEVVAGYLNANPGTPEIDEDRLLDLIYDYVLSQGLEEDVEE